jgi:hypothetical protein
MKQFYLILALSLLLQAHAWGQDLENIAKEKPVKFSGNIGLSLQSYSTTRERVSRDPFVWTLSGSPTLSIYGITLPFSFILSQKNESFRQPFNQYGASPYYKWLKLHLGYRSMSFSDYSLNGHVFNGIGLEADPGNWRLGGMFGTLLNPIPADSLSGFLIQPTYKRKGYSAKLGYGTSSNYLDLILFKGWDQVNSIDRPTDSAAVTPQENLVFALKTQQRFLSIFLFSLDLGLSGWTSNLFAGGESSNTIPAPGFISSLLKINYSTQFTKAVKSALSVRIKQVNLQLQYQRIEPDYQTMGAYFFNNDLENITISPSFSLLKRKMRVNGSVGFQRNNLFEDKSNQTNRRINSLQISYAPINQLSFTSSYTNYQVNQQQIDIIRRDVIDSLQLEQFSNNLSLSANYNFGTKVKRYAFSAGFSQQSMSQTNNNETLGNNDSKSISPTFSFRFNNKESNWGYRASANYNDFQNSNINSFRWGINGSANKSFAEDKFSLNANTSYYSTKLDGETGGNTVRLGIRGDYKPAEKHSIGFGTTFINQGSSNARIKGFSEFLGSINYSYAF